MTETEEKRKRRRWAALLFNNDTRSSRVLGFVLAANGPDANLRAWKKYRAHDYRRIFCRPAWAGSKTHYTTVRLERGK